MGPARTASHRRRPKQPPTRFPTFQAGGTVRYETTYGQGYGEAVDNSSDDTFRVMMTLSTRTRAPRT